MHCFVVPEDFQANILVSFNAWSFLFCGLKNAFGEWVMFTEFCVALNVFSVPRLSQEKIN